MNLAAVTADQKAKNKQRNGVMTSLIELGKALLRLLTCPYRPERHYMRGPGPKWREKHARA